MSAASDTIRCTSTRRPAAPKGGLPSVASGRPTCQVAPTCPPDLFSAPPGIELSIHSDSKDAYVVLQSNDDSGLYVLESLYALGEKPITVMTRAKFCAWWIDLKRSVLACANADVARLLDVDNISPGPGSFIFSKFETRCRAET